MSVKKRILLIVVLAALGAAGVWYAMGVNHEADGPLTLYGNVDIREVRMAFRQPGRLTAMHFEEGDAVSRGDLLAELDAQPYAEALALAEARVKGAEAVLAKLERGNRAQEIAQAEEAVRQARAVARNAQTEFKRQKELLASGSTSRQAFDTARTANDRAKASLAAARQALDLVREGARSEDIAAAAAELDAARAAADQAETALDDTRLFAPDRAVVLSRVLEPGSMVSASSPVYTLSLTDPIYVRAYAGEPDLGRVVPGAAVTVRTDSNDKAYHGRIGFVSPKAEFTPKAVETTDLRTDLVYRLRITVSDPDQSLRQGMPVTITLDRDGQGS